MANGIDFVRTFSASPAAGEISSSCMSPGIALTNHPKRSTVCNTIIRTNNPFSQVEFMAPYALRYFGRLLFDLTKPIGRDGEKLTKELIPA